MKGILFRACIASIAALFLSAFGVIGSVAVLQTLFGVLGVVFSVSMSLLLSFNLTGVRNDRIRRNIRYEISGTRNCIVADFAVSAIASAIAFVFGYNCFDWLLVATIITLCSILFEAYNFCRLHKLSIDIEEAILAEDAP